MSIHKTHSWETWLLSLTLWLSTACYWRSTWRWDLTAQVQQCPATALLFLPLPLKGGTTRNLPQSSTHTHTHTPHTHTFSQLTSFSVHACAHARTHTHPFSRLASLRACVHTHVHTHTHTPLLSINQLLCSPLQEQSPPTGPLPLSWACFGTSRKEN